MVPSSGPDAPWRLTVLESTVRLERGATRIVPERRTAALLALLALEGAVPRERAAELLWPDREPARARGNLRQLLFRLRSEADVVDGDPLALKGDVRRDVDEVAAIAAAPVPDRDPWPDPDAAAEVPDAHDFVDLGEIGERIAAARLRVRARLRSQLHAEAQRRWTGGDLAGAESAADRLLALDPLDEEAARLAIRARIEGNRPVQALVVYTRTRDALRRLLDVEPSPDTVSLAEEAASLASAPLRADAALAPGSLPSIGVPVVRRAEASGWLAEGAALLRSAIEPLEPGPERGRTLVQLAWLEHQAGRHDDALRAAEAGLALLQEDGDESARIEAWFVLGSIARMQGDTTRASTLFDRALATAAQRGGGEMPPARGRPALDLSLSLHLNLGMVEDGLGRADAALEHYQAALPLAESAGDRGATAIVLNNIAHLLLARGEPEMAWPLLVRAVRLAEEIADRRLRAYALEGVASCQLARGLAEQARASAAQVLSVAREWGEPFLQVEAALTFAEAEEALERPTTARDTARAALRLAHRHGDVPGSMRAAVVLARILGSDSPAARRALAVLVRDPRAGESVLNTAFAVLDRWRSGGERRRAVRGEEEEARIRNRVLASGDPMSAWDAVVDELVTPR